MLLDDDMTSDSDEDFFTGGDDGIDKEGKLRPKSYCFFKHLAINCFTFPALHSADKFSNELDK